MQYLLSEEEYRELCDAKIKHAIEFEVKLQKLCTLAAKHIPVEVDIGLPRPWGCYIDTKERNFYCDECPCLELCPNDFKELSK